MKDKVDVPFLYVSMDLVKKKSVWVTKKEQYQMINSACEWHKTQETKKCKSFHYNTFITSYL
ncbi:hypothetical protein D1818_05280 [Aquimarina sp. BL5]|nr:hypothetical protein D1818_05280 [Aquimarina sp. BL5]RKN07161.1 hypothetical protein D7036_07965 [Aquimarina sp. BL5]